MSTPYNIEGFRRIARKRLPKAVFEFIDGGSEDELAVAANREAFRSIRLVPRVHEDDTPIDVSTTLCGQPMSMPVIISPTGSAGMIHPDGDRGGAVVAARRGLIMLLSGAATYTLEEVAAAADPKPWLQLYPYSDRKTYGPGIRRAAEAGYRGLVVTIDTAQPSRRERDIANSFSTPPRLTPRNAFEIATHPRWTAQVLRHRRVVIKTFGEPKKAPLLTFVTDAKKAGMRFGATFLRVTWPELEWIRTQWDGPFGVKGICDPRDARRAVDLGADAIFVSNHGGRQLDGAIAALEALPSVVDEVGTGAEVVLDGGVRRGTDVIKALSLGARAVMIGRPWVFALAAGGEQGLDAMLAGLEQELRVSLNLIGQPVATRLDRSYLAPAGVPGLREPRILDAARD